MSDTFRWHKWGSGSIKPDGAIPEKPNYQAKLGIVGGDMSISDIEWMLDETDLFVSLEDAYMPETGQVLDPVLIEEYNMLGVYDDVNCSQ